MKKFSFLYIFAFFDGLAVASGALVGFFFPQFVSDIFGANFQTNDLIWFKFVLLPGFAINILYMFHLISLNLKNLEKRVIALHYFLEQI